MPSQFLHCSQRTEFIERDGKHIIRFYPVVYFTTRCNENALNELIDNYQFVVKVNDKLATVARGVDGEGNVYFDLEMTAAKLEGPVTIKSKVSV